MAGDIWRMWGCKLYVCMFTADVAPAWFMFIFMISLWPFVLLEVLRYLVSTISVHLPVELISSYISDLVIILWLLTYFLYIRRWACLFQVLAGLGGGLAAVVQMVVVAGPVCVFVIFVHVYVSHLIWLYIGLEPLIWSMYVWWRGVCLLCVCLLLSLLL